MSPPLKQKIEQQREEQQQLTSHDHSQQQQSIVFGDNPIRIKCPFCLNYNTTEIIPKQELISIAAGLLLFSILPNAIMAIIAIVLLQITATKKHRCSLCERQLGSNDTGILISKKIGMSIGFIVLIVCIVFLRHRYSPSSSVEFVDLSWQQFIEKCSGSSYAGACRNEFEGKTVRDWKGWIMRVDDQRDNMRRYYEHAVQIYVKMAPSETPDNEPDLILTGSSSKVYYMTEILDQISHGDQIQFNATMASLRKTGVVTQDRHLHLVDLKKTGIINNSIHHYFKDQQLQAMRQTHDKALRVESHKEDNPLHTNEQMIQTTNSPTQ